MQNRAELRPTRVEDPFETCHLCVLLVFYEIYKE
jgi:hypothetical protein